MNKFTFDPKENQSVSQSKFRRTVMDILYDTVPNKEAFESVIDSDGFYTYNLKNTTENNEHSNCCFHVPQQYVENPQGKRDETGKEEEKEEKYEALIKAVTKGKVTKRAFNKTIEVYDRTLSYISMYDGRKIKWIEQYAKGTQRYNKKQCAKIKDACNYFSTIHKNAFFLTLTFNRKIFNKNLMGTWKIGAELSSRLLNNLHDTLHTDYVKVAEAQAAAIAHYHGIIFADENLEDYRERTKKNGDKYVLKGRLRDKMTKYWKVKIKRLLGFEDARKYLNIDYLNKLLSEGIEEVSLGFFDLKIIREKEYIQNYITKYISKEKTQKIEETFNYEKFLKDKKTKKAFFTFFMPSITKTKSVTMSCPRKVTEWNKKREEEYFKEKELEGLTTEERKKVLEKKEERERKLEKKDEQFLPRYLEYKRRGESLAYLKELCTNSTIPCLRGVYISHFKPLVEEGKDRIETLNEQYGTNESGILKGCKPLNCGSCVITQLMRYAMGMSDTWFDKGDKEKELRKELEKVKDTQQMVNMALELDNAEERISDTEAFELLKKRNRKNITDKEKAFRAVEERKYDPRIMNLMHSEETLKQFVSPLKVYNEMRKGNFKLFEKYADEEMLEKLYKMYTESDFN